MKNKEKSYFVMFILETDGDLEVRGPLCAQSTRELVEKIGQEEAVIFEGNMVKGAGSKMDLSKL